MFKTKLLTDSLWIRVLTSTLFQSSVKSCTNKHSGIALKPLICAECRAAFATSLTAYRSKQESPRVSTKDGLKKSTRLHRSRFYNNSNVPNLPKARTLDDVIKPVSVSPEQSDGPDIGRELTNELDRDKLQHLLDNVCKDQKILELLKLKISANESMLEHVMGSFRIYCLSAQILHVDLHILIYDLLHNTGSSVDLVPYIVEHARIVYPHLSVMNDLKHLIVQNMVNPVSWYPETRKMKRKIIYHSGPTNSGKTYAALQRFMEAQTGVYLAPLRLLAIECFTKTNSQDVPCDLLTGERKYYIESEESPANHRACTIELLDFSAKYEVAVIDEIQMIGDLFRGGHWTQSLLGVMAQEVHVCGDGSALMIVESLAKQCGDSFEVKKYKRKTPLVIQREALGSLSNIRPGDCVVCFQVKQLFSVGEQLKNLGHNCALIYGALPPGIKINQTEMFNDPDNSCNLLVATDAVGMGLNLAIQRIVFYGVEKIGLKENEGEVIDRFSREKMVLSTSEAIQIAGRAGRYGGQYNDKGGEVTALHATDLKILRHLLKQEIPKIQKAGLVVRGDVIETFAYYLPGVPFSRILMMFIAMCETNQEYFMCDTSPLVKNAMLIDHIDMPLRDKLIFCQSPLRHRVSSRGIDIYVQMARHISEATPMTLTWFLKQVRFPRSTVIKDTAHFEYALEVFHLTDIFLWLSFKFDEFQTIEGMRSFRMDLDKALRAYIELNYTAINKGTVLQLTSSKDIQELIAEKGTFNDDALTNNMNDPLKKESKSIPLSSSKSRKEKVYAKSSSPDDDLSDNNLIKKVKEKKAKQTGSHVQNDLMNDSDGDPLAQIWYNHTHNTVSETDEPKPYKSHTKHEKDEFSKVTDCDKASYSCTSDPMGDESKATEDVNAKTNSEQTDKKEKTETEIYEERIKKKLGTILDDNERGIDTGELSYVDIYGHEVDDSVNDLSVNACDTKDPQLNPVGALLMYFQKQRISNAVKFKLISAEGPPHQPIFTMGIEGFECIAKGNTKKEAMRKVAVLALSQLQKERKLHSVFPDYKVP